MGFIEYCLQDEVFGVDPYGALDYLLGPGGCLRFVTLKNKKVTSAECWERKNALDERHVRGP
jgi:hypothetical protein